MRIDKKIHSWSGSIEVGVTACDPDSLEAPFPSSATELRHGTWIMSGNSILRDGRSVNENYGTDLDKLEEGDRVGVVREVFRSPIRIAILVSVLKFAATVRHSIKCKISS